MKRIILILGLTLAVAGAQTVTEADKRAIAEANRYVQRGNEFVEKESLARAKVEYQRALKVFPQHLDALYNLAVVCENLNESDEALALYEKYLALKPNDADVWTQLGVRYDALNRPAEAKAAYQKALLADPKFGRAHHNLGVRLMEDGQLDEAQKHLEAFLVLEEKTGNPSGDAYYSLGALHLRRGQLVRAKVLLQKAADMNPNVAYYHNAIGDVYLAEKNYDLARANYKKAIEKDAKYAPAHSGMGDTYRLQGDRDKAVAAYKRALELRKDYHLILFKLGLAFEASDPVAARKYFENYLASGKNLEFAKQAQEKLDKLNKPTKP
jgi:tetratricopeptide (TPR) repeat protein